MSISPDKAKEKFYAMRNDLLTVKSHWEQSGIGDGSVRNIAADYDDASTMEHFNGNDKKEFLNGRNAACLYLWEITDEMGILTSVCQAIDEDNRYDSADISCASYSCGKIKRRHSGSPTSMSYIDTITTELLNESTRVLIKSNEISEKQLDVSVQLNKSYNTNNIINYNILIQSNENTLCDLQDRLEETEPGTDKHNRLKNAVTL